MNGSAAEGILARYREKLLPMVVSVRLLYLAGHAGGLPGAAGLGGRHDGAGRPSHPAAQHRAGGHGECDGVVYRSADDRPPVGASDWGRDGDVVVLALDLPD